MMKAEIFETLLKDPRSGRDVPALKAVNGRGIEAVILPGRALDMYSLSYRGTPISYTDKRASIDRACGGTESFLEHFFAGFYTTCGLIQSGRPCEENGRIFGLHGDISNTRAEGVRIGRGEGFAEVSARIDERHAEGEHMRLSRCLRVPDDRSAIALCDEVTNMSNCPTPFMMMYHINFGAPFLSEALEAEASFDYIENRDTALPATADELLQMGAEGSRDGELVYYTRPDFSRGVRLFQPELGIGCRMIYSGDDLKWMGVWKNFVFGRYALGIEPGNCPGLGRVNARERGLLPMLLPGETSRSAIHVEFFEADKNDNGLWR